MSRGFEFNHGTGEVSAPARRLRPCVHPAGMVCNKLGMQSLRHRILQAAVSVACILAWLVATNHCALADLATRGAATAVHAAGCNHCPAHETGKPGRERMGECCKTFKSTAKPADGFHPRAGDAVPSCGPMAVHSDPVVAAVKPVFSCGAAPPWLLSQAERIFQRSLLAHAPPSRA